MPSLDGEQAVMATVSVSSQYWDIVAKQIRLKMSLHGATGAWWEFASRCRGQAVSTGCGSEGILTFGAGK